MKHMCSNYPWNSPYYHDNRRFGSMSFLNIRCKDEKGNMGILLTNFRENSKKFPKIHLLLIKRRHLIHTIFNLEKKTGPYFIAHFINLFLHHLIHGWPNLKQNKAQKFQLVEATWMKSKKKSLITTQFEHCVLYPWAIHLASPPQENENQFTNDLIYEYSKNYLSSL